MIKKLRTGATDGVGLGFSKEFCKRGFNICLIARNEQKLKEVQKQLKEINPDSQTTIIIADFSNSHQEGFFEKIVEQLTNLDIAILINNVGLGKIAKFDEMDPQLIKEFFIVNCLSQVFMTKKIISKMEQREKKSLILNVSSQSAISPLIYSSVYGSTKLFNKYFSIALSYEQNKIDVVSLNLGYVSTSLTANKKTSFICLTIDECAKGVAKQLGYGDKEIHASWRHELFLYIMALVPLSIIKNHRLKEMQLRNESANIKSQQKKNQ